MKHLKGFNLYNEGLFNYIRSKRFKDDDIIQNLIKIINNYIIRYKKTSFIKIIIKVFCR